MSQENKVCPICNILGHSRYYCRVRRPKRIPIKGRRTLEYEQWRDEVGIPHLDKTTGRICQACLGDRCGNRQLDVDHILNRGSHPELIKDVNNIQYLGREPCHRLKTEGKL